MGVSLKETEKGKTQRHKEECDVNTEARVEVMHLQTKECQGLPSTTRSWERSKGMGSPSEPPEETNPGDTLTSDFWPPEL